MTSWIENLLVKPSAWVLAKILITFTFWLSGITKLVFWDHGIAAMERFHLYPYWAFNLATITVQLVGSYLVIWTRWAWLGAGALAVFTLATIPIAMDFWNKEGAARGQAMSNAAEHISVIGALFAAVILRAILDAQRRPTV